MSKQNYSKLLKYIQDKYNEILDNEYQNANKRWVDIDNNKPQLNCLHLSIQQKDSFDKQMEQMKKLIEYDEKHADELKKAIELVCDRKKKWNEYIMELQNDYKSDKNSSTNSDYFAFLQRLRL